MQFMTLKKHSNKKHENWTEGTDRHTQTHTDRHSRRQTDTVGRTDGQTDKKLLDGSITLPPLYPCITNDCHVSVAKSPPAEFLP